MSFSVCIVFELHVEELHIKNRNCPTPTLKYLLYPCKVKVALREFEDLGEWQVAVSQAEAYRVMIGGFQSVARLSSWISDLTISVALRLYPNRLQVLRGLCRR